MNTPFLKFSKFPSVFFALGYLLLLSLLSFICFALYVLSFKPVRDKVVNYMKGGG